MADVKNPRYPHTCVIYRSLVSDPMVDSKPLSTGDPMEDDFESGETAGEETVQEEPKTKVIYEGICRSYNRDTVSDNGDAIVSYRGLALPIEQDKWTEDTIPLEGDTIIVYRKGFKEYGTVTDKRPGNLGTHLIWKYARN